jgi:hypothetical protein
MFRTFFVCIIFSRYRKSRLGLLGEQSLQLPPPALHATSTLKGTRAGGGHTQGLPRWRDCILKVRLWRTSFFLSPSWRSSFSCPPLDGFPFLSPSGGTSFLCPPLEGLPFYVPLWRGLGGGSLFTHHPPRSHVVPTPPNRKNHAS